MAQNLPGGLIRPTLQYKLKKNLGVKKSGIPNFQAPVTNALNFNDSKISGLTDTGEKVQKWTRVFFDSALSHTRRSDASEKRRRKYSRPLLAKFACGQVSSPRLYRLRAPEKRSDGIRNRTLWRREIL